ncbi:MAG: tRNA preQ1(34) S-adenosylmethionine ribosyltransferase-isomerase QueA [Deltaproteobacteria bacterium]|nr:tRNA preQ1(34) S-adenosylmethionine ribosyltransferase-isomerase QueA [Deltaproteobacteria bacterium]
MDIKDFEFDLPEGLIAQYPLPERDSSRLMALSRSTGELSHASFRDLPEFLRKGDLLILNDTKVMPARLLGKKSSGGKVEVLLIERLESTGDGREEWACLIRNSKGLKDGSLLFFNTEAEAEVRGFDEKAGLWRVSFKNGPHYKEAGRIPLPPYIRREPEELDKTRYQTVFAGVEGAVAAPTAGLHFTDKLLSDIRDKGVETRFITLHTGPGTFMPVRVTDVRDHRMHGERYAIDNSTCEAIKKAKAEGRRVIAVGTTSTRALEAAFKDGFDAPVLSGTTDIFIYPGFRFRVIDGLLTNFHLPGSTLIMLVAAFAGMENTLAAYREAVKAGYRFFSYGDAMLIL